MQCVGCVLLLMLLLKDENKDNDYNGKCTMMMNMSVHCVIQNNDMT